MNAEGVSTIVNCLKPHVKAYFDQLIDNGSLETLRFHPSYEYPAEVTDRKCWPHFGIFYDYLVRREIYVLLKKPAFDKRAEMYKSALEKYNTEIEKGNQIDKLHVEDGRCISASYRNISKLKKFLASYKIFEDIENRTIDILEDIFNTSMLHMMSYGRLTVPYRPEFINLSNITDVLNYVRAWDLKRIKINPRVGGRFFIGDADLIFRDSILDMKVSMYHPDEETFKRSIYQMIFYALGYFIKKGRERRTFEVYNPLLGVVHVLDLQDLDFNELRRQVDNEPCWEDC